MACENCGQNQTQQDSFDALTKDARESGSGLFAIPAPEAGILEYKVIVVKDISYDECAKRGQNCNAFKWIAASIMSPADVEDNRKRFPCGSYTCPPPLRCPGNCICLIGSQRCA
jgi:hypothetical protein